MCTFTFVYQIGENEIKKCFPHIVQVNYMSSTTKPCIVKEDELLKHCFPINKTLYLFSEDTNYSVDGNQICYIEIKKEN